MLRLAVLFCGLVLAAAVPAQSMPGMQHEATEHGTVHKGNGTLTKVDRGKSRATIKHDAVQSLKWPAMTMTFAVKDRALLERMQAGRQIEFRFVQQGRDYVITEVK